VARAAWLSGFAGIGAALVLVLLPSAAWATFHVARISEIMTSYGGDSAVQFVEMEMLAAGQTQLTGSKLNVFDADGSFVATAVTLDHTVGSGAGRAWLMGTPAFETASGLQVDFEFPDGSLPTGGGMVCWGMPGSAPTPISCPVFGTPYVDCIAYGSYSGAGNDCIGNPTPLDADGHSLRRTSNDHDNLTTFACVDPAEPENNAMASAIMAATSPCAGDTTTTSTTTTNPRPTTTTTASSTTLLSTTTTTPSAQSCGDGNGDGSITASDALLALRTAVGSASCPVAVCDVDANGSVSAGDALRILAHAVGQPVELTCAVA
jgi:Dockerin type I domain